MKKSLAITFWALTGTFLFVLSEFFVPTIEEFFSGSLLFLAPMVVFSLLGILLVSLALREETQGKLKKYLILTGVSAIGFFVFVFLHNLFYALNIVTNNIIILRYLTEVLHVVSFLIAIFACPLGFLIGTIGSIVILVKRKRL